MNTNDEADLLSIKPPEPPYWWNPLQKYLPTLEFKGMRLLAHLTSEYDLSVLLELDAPPGVISIMYPLEGYRKIAEFRTALAFPMTTEIGNGIQGNYFFAYTAGKADRVYWQGRGHAITICVTTDQWNQIRELFDTAFKHPEYARAWTRLAAQQGQD